MRTGFKIFLLPILAGIFLGSTASGACSAELLTISYFERPPYYFTDKSGQPAGQLVERTETILKHAEVDAELVRLTPYRIMYVLRHGAVPHCSIGWFKTAEREQFAKFSAPIYRDKPLVLLTSVKQAEKFSGLATLQDVFRNRQLKMARMTEFSYGQFVDQLLDELSPEVLFLSGEQTDLLRAIVGQKAAFMLVAPEEIANLADLSGVSEEQLFSLELDDIPAGNARYLMCSEAVTDETMLQLNAAISSLYPITE